MSRPFEYTVRIDTIPFSNGVIEQKTDIMGEITSKIIDTRTYQVEQALIRLGWLPPEQVNNLHKQLDIAESFIVPNLLWAYRTECEDKI